MSATLLRGGVYPCAYPSRHMSHPHRHRLLSFLCFVALLSPCASARAQGEAQLYRAAYGTMAGGQTDSTLALLDTLAARYGHDDTGLYADLMMDDTFRPLHGDARWAMLMGRLAAMKHEVEDTTELACPQHIEPIGRVAKPAEATRYRLRAEVDARAKRLRVDGTVTVDFHGRPYIDFGLWRHTDITAVEARGHAMAHAFDPDSSQQWMPQAGRLRVFRGRRDRVRLHVAYTARLDSLDTWMTACDSDFVQLSMYMAWYPYNDDSRFRADVTFVLDPRFEATGSGRMVRAGGGEWRMSQPWEGFDLGLVASPRLQRRRVAVGGRTVETAYLQMDGASVDSLAACCEELLGLYAGLYRVRPDARELRVVLLPHGGGAFSRRNYIVGTARRYNENLFGLMGHELAHFWWHSAPTDSWLDWLNESFAEYSMLRALRHHYGEGVAADYLAAYRENTRHTCPIFGLDREAPGAYTVFYQKGALLLHDLQRGVGEARFLRFMQTVARRRVASHAQLWRAAKSTLGAWWAEWIERRLQE